MSNNTAEALSIACGFLTGVWMSAFLFHTIPVEDPIEWWGFPWAYSAIAGSCLLAFFVGKCLYIVLKGE